MKKFFRILRYVKGYWRYATLNIICNTLSVLFGLFSLTMVAPFLNLLFLNNDAEYAERLAKGAPAAKLSFDSAIDNFNYYLTKIIAENGKPQALLFICILVVGFILLKNFFRYLAMYFLANIRNGVVKDLRNELYDKSLQLPLSYYTGERKGDLMSRMTTDVQEIEWSIMNSLEMLFRDPINIIILFGSMIYISPKLTLFMFILIPLPALIIGRIASSLRKTSAKGKVRLGTLFSILEETLSGLRVIKAFNAEKPMNKKFRDENESYTKLMIRMYRKTDLSGPLSEFLGVAVLVVLIFYGGSLVLDAKLSASVFILYIAIFSQLITPIKALTTAYYVIQKGIASAERIEKILDAEITVKDAADPKIITVFNREIEYKDVSFAYTKGDQGYVLKNINLRIPKGRTIALVGQSGSGKTTLADILPRFHDISAGEVLIDGTPIKEIKVSSLRNLMGVVTQESILFNDTVLNNIAFGMVQVREEDVIEAARIANAHDFISEMPQKYHTNIGDRGSKLSGGQRQRLSIARAILKNPPILILDEATSALDTESEKLVQDALNRLMQNRTTIVIAHRLSTILHADEIIVLQKGEIIERGTHAELLSKNGTYKKLYDLQVFS